MFSIAIDLLLALGRIMLRGFLTKIRILKEPWFCSEKKCKRFINRFLINFFWESLLEKWRNPFKVQCGIYNVEDNNLANIHPIFKKDTLINLSIDLLSICLKTQYQFIFRFILNFWRDPPLENQGNPQKGLSGPQRSLYLGQLASTFKKSYLKRFYDQLPLNLH